MQDITRLETTRRYSEVTIHNGTAYLSGQIADDASKGMRGQMTEVLASIDRLLASAGTDKTKLLSAQIFIRDLAEFAIMNEVWDAWLPPGCAPARATVEANLADPAWKVEVVIVAAVIPFAASVADG